MVPLKTNTISAYGLLLFIQPHLQAMKPLITFLKNTASPSKSVPYMKCQFKLITVHLFISLASRFTSILWYVYVIMFFFPFLIFLLISNPMSYCKEVFAVWDKCMQHDLEGEPLCSGYGQVIMNILTGFLMKVGFCILSITAPLTEN